MSVVSKTCYLISTAVSVGMLFGMLGTLTLMVFDIISFGSPPSWVGKAAMVAIWFFIFGTAARITELLLQARKEG